MTHNPPPDSYLHELLNLSARVALYDGRWLITELLERRAAAHTETDTRNTLNRRLDTIAELLTPCPAPDTTAGYDLCPCGRPTTWPCPTTRAAWLARGIDPTTETRRILDAQTAHATPGN
ncbi:hypothetical protein ACWDUL_21155 [Nocardia niigatensis]